MMRRRRGTRNAWLLVVAILVALVGLALGLGGYCALGYYRERRTAEIFQKAGAGVGWIHPGQTLTFARHWDGAISKRVMSITLSAEQLRTLGPLLSRFNQLRCLTVSGGRLDAKSIQTVARLSTVRHLCLQNCSGHEVPITEISRLHNLETLTIDVHAISIVGLASVVGLKNLQRLEVYGEGVDDSMVPELERFRGLELDIRDTRISKDGFRRLCDQLPEWTAIYYYGPRFGPGGPDLDGELMQ